MSSNTTSRLVGFVIAAVAAAGLCRGVIAIGGGSPKSSAKAVVEPQNPVTGQDPRQMAEIQSRVRELESELARQRELLAASVADRGARPAPQATSDGTRAAPSASSPLRSPTSREVVEQLDATFYQQPTTPWGRQAEARVTAALPGTVQGGTIERVECRETMCRIEATHEDLRAFGSFARQFASPQAVAALWNGAVSAQVTDQSQGRVSSVIFFAREDREIPPAEDVPEQVVE